MSGFRDNDFWNNAMNLTEGTLLARVTDGGKAMFGKITGDSIELLDDSLKLTGKNAGVSGAAFKAPIDPTKVWCIGLNYHEHAKESNLEVPDEPCVFMKPTTCIIAPGEAIGVPSWTGRVDYEGELAVVIGKTCKNVAPEHALDYVLGYSCFNDVSARVLQKKDGQWIRAKAFDTFGPFGPAILIQRKIPDSAVLTTKLNGKIVQQGPFSDMIFSVAAIVSHLSRFATLEAGDIIATGTPAGVGPIQPGDAVEITIDGIGTLKNPVAVA
ncbi:hypothetical protein FACS1894187_24820 [Synergistales bacterium]|nr:hypothetical protein FACS1894187_24820 [Synergistales bacterium]